MKKNDYADYIFIAKIKLTNQYILQHKVTKELIIRKGN